MKDRKGEGESRLEKETRECRDTLKDKKYCIAFGEMTHKQERKCEQVRK